MDASKVHIGEVNIAGDTQDLGLSICTIKPRRVKVAAKVNQRKLSQFMTSSCRLKYCKRASLSPASSGQELNPSFPCHAIFIFLDPLLLGVLQVEYQNKQKWPSDTHPVQMRTFLMAICIYCAVLGIRIHYTQARSRSAFHDQILSFLLLVSGSLSSASLLSILLHRILLLLVLIIWGSIPIIMARQLFKNSVYWILGLVAKLNLKSKFSTMASVFHRMAQSSNNNPTDRV